MQSSLSARLLISVSILLLFFFGATIVVLDMAFRRTAEKAQEDILDGQLMALLAAAEPNAAGELQMPPDLPEARLNTIGSGLYAELRGINGQSFWQSRSALGMALPSEANGPPVYGEPVYEQRQLADGTPLMTLQLAVEWELADGTLNPYVFVVTESLDSLNAQIARFRGQLFTWFAAVATIMLIAIGFVLRGLLRPLRQIEREIEEIENGERGQLSAGLPTELTGVARNMNTLIGSERKRAERYRHTLDNLAHALKTPLAAMRALLEDTESPRLVKERLEAQIEQMNEIVRYQLRKTSHTGAVAAGVAVIDVAAELERLVDAMQKVYREKGLHIELAVAGPVRFRGDKGDLLELTGNLLDNACKWCRSRVLIDTTGSDGDALELVFVDDGPGIPDEAAEQLLERGMRLDESKPGQGIGLAVVKEIAASYGGSLEISRADLGGARITVRLPISP